jgi:FtsH-binding integral membrane protein
MSSFESSAAAISGPASERITFLRKVGVLTFFGLLGASVLGVLSTVLVVPAVARVGDIGVIVFFLGTFALAHWVARGMVYGSMKMPGFILAIVGEGVSLGLILLMTVANFGVGGGIGLIAQCMMMTAATAGGMLLYVWFNKSEFSWLKAGLAMVTVPMLLAMVLSAVWPIGGTFGLILTLGFVVVSAAGLLYRLNHVVHELDTTQHIEGAYEITMGILILFWNLLSLLNRLKR